MMSKATRVMMIFNCVLMFILCGAQASKVEKQAQDTNQSKIPPVPTRYCGTNATATTLKKLSSIPGNGQFVKTDLTFTMDKLEDSSTLFYTCQITFQMDISKQVGIHFKMRVKDESGNYIMPDMMTGALSHGAGAYQNAMLSDTVFSNVTGGDPGKGKYTFELWALAGMGNLTIVPYMSNIAVLQLPSARPCN